MHYSTEHITFIVPRGHMLVSEMCVANGLACHILVSVCLLGSDSYFCAKPENLRLSRGTAGI